MQCVESNILKIPFSVTAGHRQPPECKQNNDDSCSQLEALRGGDGRDGRDGRDGERGIPGERGEKGERGPIGHSGTCGPLEPVGEKGQAGEKGERASVGLSGAIGAQGRAGEKGQQGERGEKGQRGERGQVGLSGPHGDQGPGGVKGERGETSEQGQKGDRGPVGPLGARGYQGLAEEKGMMGSPGLRGPAGSRAACGQMYVRWGRTTCPGNQSTELVYSGRAGGSRWSQTGGATNYFCMPDNPEYLQYDSDVQGFNYVYGVEYNPASGQPLNVKPNVDGHNVPCAVCMAVSRCSLLMIPGKTSCPVSWTTEYVGYLMSGAQGNTLTTTYECVDKDPESVPGLNAGVWNIGMFTHVEASRNGMACPPYVAGRELTCVVCTR